MWLASSWRWSSATSFTVTLSPASPHRAAETRLLSVHWGPWRTPSNACLVAESADGMTMEELVEKAGQQSSVALTRHEVLEAMKLLQEEIVREGGRYMHVLTT